MAAGKSTLLNAVAGTFPVDAGSISLGGVDVTKLPEHKRAQYIGRVFQDPMLGTAPTMQIEENLALAARRGKSRGLRWGITKTEREDYIQRLKILDLGLEERAHQQGGAALRRPAAGPHAADGHIDQAPAAPAGQSILPPWTPRPPLRCWMPQTVWLPRST